MQRDAKGKRPRKRPSKSLTGRLLVSDKPVFKTMTNKEIKRLADMPRGLWEVKTFEFEDSMDSYRKAKRKAETWETFIRGLAMFQIENIFVDNAIGYQYRKVITV